MENKKWLKIAGIVVGVALIAFVGWKFFNKPGAAPQAGAVPVKAIAATQADTPIIYEFVGEIRPQNEAQITSRVSGMIIERYVNGGELVTKGQPLFKIDPRDYETSVLAMRSELLSAEIVYTKNRQNRMRYLQLLEGQAIAQKTSDDALALENQSAAQVENVRASLAQQELNLSHTIIRAPMDGRLDVSIVSTGTFATAGQTALATVSTLNPVRVQFSINETDYLQFAKAINMGNLMELPVDLVLANGATYSERGRIVEINRGLTQQTGTLTMKAQFGNPADLLIPGMFARVQLQGEVRKNAILVPQRAVYMQLTKSFVTVVGADGKAEVRAVTVGPKVGQLFIAESGVEPGDKVVVEGQQKTKQGVPLQVTEIQVSDLKIPVVGE